MWYNIWHDDTNTNITKQQLRRNPKNNENDITRSAIAEQKSNTEGAITKNEKRRKGDRITQPTIPSGAMRMTCFCKHMLLCLIFLMVLPRWSSLCPCSLRMWSFWRKVLTVIFMMSLMLPKPWKKRRKKKTLINYILCLYWWEEVTSIYIYLTFHWFHHHFKKIIFPVYFAPVFSMQYVVSNSDVTNSFQ